MGTLGDRPIPLLNGLKKKLDFAMDIDNFFGKVMNKIMEYQIFCQSAQKDKSLEFMANHEISPA